MMQRFASFFFLFIFLSCACVCVTQVKGASFDRYSLGNLITSTDVSANDFYQSEYCWVSGTVYAFASKGDGSKIDVTTVNISADGTSITKKANKLYADNASGSTPNPDIAKVYGNIYAIVYRDTSGGDGQIFTINISNDGTTIGNAIDRWEFDTINGENPSINRVTTSVPYTTNNTMIICYAGYDQDGWAKTVNISYTGAIYKTAVSSYEFDTAYYAYAGDVKTLADKQHFLVPHNGGSTEVHLTIIYVTGGGKTITASADVILPTPENSYSQHVEAGWYGTHIIATFFSQKYYSSGTTTMVLAANFTYTSITIKDVQRFNTQTVSDPFTYNSPDSAFVSTDNCLVATHSTGATARCNFEVLSTIGTFKYPADSYNSVLGGSEDWTRLLTPLNSNMSSGHFVLARNKGMLYAYHYNTTIDTALTVNENLVNCTGTNVTSYNSTTGWLINLTYTGNASAPCDCNSTNLTIEEWLINCTGNATTSYNSTTGWTVNNSYIGNCSGNGTIDLGGFTDHEFAVVLPVMLMGVFMLVGYRSRKRSGGAFMLLSGFLLVAIAVEGALAVAGWMLCFPLGIFLMVLGIRKWLFMPEGEPKGEEG